MKKWIILFLALALAAVAIGVLTPHKIVTFANANVSGGVIRSFLNDIAPHISEGTFLKIGDRTYKNLRGVEPYYLAIPAIEAILFMVEGRNDNVTIHVVFLSDHKDIEFEAGEFGLGSNIGSKRAPGEKMTDYIESADLNHIVYAARFNDRKETIALNLATRTLGQRELFEYNSNGEVTNHLVYSHK